MVKMENGVNPYFLNKEVKDYEVSPQIEINHTPTDVLMLSEDLKKVFLKATVKEIVIRRKIGGPDRESGIYHFGKATCKLTKDADGDCRMEISTDCFDGLKDIDLISIKIRAGRITPTISFEGKQVRNHPLEILRQLLVEKPLTKVQRFFLSWRLSRN